MTVTLSADGIRISGAGRIEDAEHLLVLLQADNRRLVDLAEAEVLHTAVVQVLLAFRPHVRGRPADPFFNTWVMPGLTGASADPGIVAVAATVSEVAATDAHGSDLSTPSEKK
jgi:hypothetical protein